MNLNNSLRKTPVAVIGMSALFADAKNVEEFWNNIIQAKDCITDVPPSRWAIEDYYDPDFTAPDKTYCKRGGFLPYINFNPMEFGLPPNILEVTDVSQLLGLVAARDAFEDAGYGQKSPKFTRALKDKTGVLLGVAGGQKLITPLGARLQYPVWEKVLRASGMTEEDIPKIVDKIKKAYVGWNENSFPGFLGNVISGRITNRFDLGGINSVVDAACAASLSAIKMALSELVEGRADMMLTGGIDTDNTHFMYMAFSKTPAFSMSGNISPFSDNADGMLIGEGLGMLVLKRLADAERDGDQIYAVIKGVGTSSDGRYKSVYAPRSAGQAMAIERAYEEAGYDPKTVELIEGHGTGTGAGDPTEFNSMQMVFGKDNSQEQHIALGSVKSQIGHTKAAAGSAGIIKAILALHHKILPPTINVAQPNSKFDIENSAFYVNTETRPWILGQTPRRASVSAFGFGGINVHIAMEEYTKSQESTYRIHQPYKAILLNTNTPSELLTICQQTLQRIEKDSDTGFKSLIDISNKGLISQNQARLGFVVTNAEECKAFLKIAIKNLEEGTPNWEHPKGIYYRANGVASNTKVVALFSGQGAQYVGMGKEIANAFPPMLAAFSQMNAVFAEEGEERITKTIFPNPVFSKAAEKAQQFELTKTQNAQPAIGTFSMGLYKILQQAGFKADFTAGHSFGELTALWAAGVYDDATFLAIAKARGAAMSTKDPNAETGTMLVVKASLAQVEQAITRLRGVTIANVNSNNQVILGGSKEAIENATTTLKVNGFSVVPLLVSAAFHTEFVSHAQKPFAAFLASQKFNSPQIPVYSNTTSGAYPKDTTSIQNILQEHILKPVLFKKQVEHMYQAGGRIFVEFGPKGILTNLVKDILKGQDFQAIALNANAVKNSDLLLRQAVIQLRVLGVGLSEIDVYKKPSKIEPELTKLNVKLSGYNYVSASTKKAFTDALNDGFKIKGGETRIIEKPIIKEVEKIVEVERIVEVEKIVEVPVEKIIEKVVYQPNNEEDMNKEIVELLKSTLSHFKIQQTRSMDFLSAQTQQSQQLLNMLSEQLSIAQNQILKPSNGNGHSKENGRIHIDSTTSPTFAPIVEEKIAVVAPSTRLTEAVAVKKIAEIRVAPVTEVDKNKLENILLTVIADKTGYPAEMLELNMDMEADLGIDSIKRVEIFGAMTEGYPEVSGINPNDLTELRTLGQIVGYLAGKIDGPVTANNNGQQAALIAQPIIPQSSNLATTNVQPIVIGGVDTKKIENMLLTVIADKTGYPAEMLELNMDMEADLGIDSIKRVEIFGTMTEDYPEVTSINPNDLTELRTLGQIVDYISETIKKKTSNITEGIKNIEVANQVETTKVVVSTISKTTTFHGVGRHQVSLQYLPQPDFLNFQLPSTHIALITNDGTALTSETFKALEEKGNRVVVLNLLRVANNLMEGKSITLAANTDDAIAEALQGIEQQYGKVGTFIHLHPHLTFQNGNFSQHFQTEKILLKSVFLIAKHLRKSLTELGNNQRANFLTVSQMDGYLGQGKRGNVSVLAGGFRGLIKSLNLEWSSVYCRAVDLEYELTVVQKSKQVIAELHDADVSIVETAFSKVGRRTIIATPVEVVENQEIKTTVTKDSVFLVSGGAKGVTATCVKEIAKTFGCKFILLGRSSNDFEIPVFAKSEDNEGVLKRLIMKDLQSKGEIPNLPKVKSIYNQIISKKEIQGTLDALASYGSEAIYLKGDVTNIASFKAELAKITTKLGAITGVIHGAGRLADKYIQDKTETDFDNVLSVKLDGLLSLLQSVDIHKLDHLLLFSSVAGFYGNIGQTDYAIANEILSSAAYLFKTNHPNTHVSAINWGAWDGGMVSDALKKQLEAAGISLVNSEGGAAMCVNELSGNYFNEPQVVIGGTLPAGISHISKDLRTYKIQRNIRLKDNPFLYHHVIQGKAVLPVVNAGSWMAQSCEKLFPDFQVFKIEDMKLFKGIVFEDKNDRVRYYTLELKELEKSTDKIVFEVIVSSQSKGKKLPTYHYKTKITLRNKKAIPAAPRHQVKLSGNNTSTTCDHLYLDGSLFHGRYFQGIEQILDCNDQQIVLSCKSPKVPASAQGQFPVRSINTFFADIQYQGMLIWVQKYNNGAKGLPLATVSVVIYESVPFEKELFVQIKIVENSDYKLVANCTTYDADGKVYSVTEGAAMAVSKGLEW